MINNKIIWHILKNIVLLHLKIKIMFKKEIINGYVIKHTSLEYCEALQELQDIVFPTLNPEERMQAQHYRKHIEIFPEGQFMILDGDKAIAMTSTIRYHLAMEDHSFLDISQGLWMTSHEPDSDWLYGMDVGVHPDYRGKGLAREIYRVRQELCQQLGLKGQITVGMPNGYLALSEKMSLDEYATALIKGDIFDPTVSVQQRMGFKLIRLIHNYLDDPQCGNGGILMTLEAEKYV
jgi:GNAT superfamily N-acetyltransferase